MSELPINSLSVRNFRCLRELHLKSIGRVNLVTGRNSVGKSYVLEALELYAHRGALDVLIDQMRARGDFLQQRDPARQPPPQTEPVDRLAPLFFGWGPTDFGQSFSISSEPGTLEITVVSELPPRSAIAEADEAVELDDDLRQPYLKTYWNGEAVQRRNLLMALTRRQGQFLPSNQAPLLLARRLQLDAPSFAELAMLWGRVLLLEPGQHVLDAMRLIQPELEGLVFLEMSNGSERYVPHVKLRSMTRLVPLQVLGDGLVRILAVMLCLVSAEGGLLFLDEVETGLHYSVEYDLWRLIFRTARERDVQVFATTHSWDCIRGFRRAAMEDRLSEGYLHRLQRRDDLLHVTTFDEQQLATATDNDLEVRG